MYFTGQEAKDRWADLPDWACIDVAEAIADRYEDLYDTYKPRALQLLHDFRMGRDLSEMNDKYELGLSELLKRVKSEEVQGQWIHTMK